VEEALEATSLEGTNGSRKTEKLVGHFHDLPLVFLAKAPVLIG